MGWNASVNFDSAQLVPPSEVFPDIIKAANERSDAQAFGTERPFKISGQQFLATGYSGSITSLSVTLSYDMGSFNTRGIIVLREGDYFDEVPYSAVSGTGTSRTFVVDITLTGTYTSGLEIQVCDVDPDYIGLYTLYELTDEIDDFITLSIPKFADISQATGNKFIGKTSIPMWTEASIIAAIGDTERILGNPLIVSADWVSQVYNILNRLVWFVGRPKYPSSRNIKVRQAGDTSWAQLAANWPGSWTIQSSSSSDYIIYIQKDKGPTTYTGVIAAKNYLYWNAIPTIKKDVDLYMYSVKPVQFEYVDTYDNQGLNLVENEWSQLMTISGSVLNTGEFDVAGLKSTVPDAPPDVNEKEVHGFRVWTYNNSIKTIMRYDVTDGFEYQ